MQDSVEVGDHVSWQWYVVTPHHHDTKQPVGHGFTSTEGLRQCQGLEVEGRDLKACMLSNYKCVCFVKMMQLKQMLIKE